MCKTALMLSLAFSSIGLAQSVLPATSTKPALKDPHFPSRLHAFIWRNWECFPAERLASVVGATPEQIKEIGHAMGLPDWPVMDNDQFRRNYISVIRRNWHLLNYEQLLKLLNWTPEQLAYTLREDDFLWHKLGTLKPASEPIHYAEPDAPARERCDAIKHLVEPIAQKVKPMPRFAFVEELSKPLAAKPAPVHTTAPGEKEPPLRFLYSYFAVYGDPLLNPDLDPYPDGLLERLAAVGANGVWMHVVLRDLAANPKFPEFGKNAETRLANLQKLVDRAKRFGVRIYLYMNEPRGMPEAFFATRPELRGVKEGDFTAMCTSVPAVRQWISDSLEHVFRTVPDLGGVFTITASENLTNCCSHFQQAGCPRCSKRQLPEVIAEVNSAIAEGVHRGSPTAKVIAWDWGWPNAASPDIIRLLPDGVWLMSVSEWDQPFTRGGVSSAVGEYSLSVVGPGPRAKKHWELARARGLKTVAKIQANCTWELSPIPYLPVMNLVARHCAALRDQHVDGLMLSWTLGGCPSPNLQLVQKIMDNPQLAADVALEQVAEERYGPGVAPAMLKAWSEFSRAFEEFPYNGALLYNGPQQVGPANLLYLQPTGYNSTMVGFPYDHLDGWRGQFPAEVLASQFEKICDGWKKGIDMLSPGIMTASRRNRIKFGALVSDLQLHHAALIHLTSTANQIRFYMARNARDAKTSTASQRDEAIAQMRRIIRNESELAAQLLDLTARDSRIGYEASNHYNYLPGDLLEKIVSDDWLTQHLGN